MLMRISLRSVVIIKSSKTLVGYIALKPEDITISAIKTLNGDANRVEVKLRGKVGN